MPPSTYTPTLVDSYYYSPTSFPLDPQIDSSVRTDDAIFQFFPHMYMGYPHIIDLNITALSIGVMVNHLTLCPTSTCSFPPHLTSSLALSSMPMSQSRTSLSTGLTIVLLLNNVLLILRLIHRSPVFQFFHPDYPPHPNLKHILDHLLLSCVLAGSR